MMILIYQIKSMHTFRDNKMQNQQNRSGSWALRKTQGCLYNLGQHDLVANYIYNLFRVSLKITLW